VDADLFRLYLCEIYLQIIAGNEKPSLSVLLNNLPVILKVLVTGPTRIRTVVAHAIKNPQFDPEWALCGLG
jgi:hypothetical protein